jgi:hypothetical protein
VSVVIVYPPPLGPKLPLFTIPHPVAFSVAPELLMLTPFEVVSNAYKQPEPAPPLTFVATARAVIVSLFTPKILMK